MRSRLETCLFGLALAALVAPLAWFSNFPSQDGPDHAAVEHVMRDLDRPGGDLLREYFESSPGGLPNQLTYFVVTRVLAFLTLAAGERVMLILFVLGLPLAMRYAATAFDPRAGRIAWLALPFVYNHLFLMGFFSFSFGLIGFLVTVGFYRRRKGQPARRWAPTLAGLAVGVYLCHPVALVATGVALLGLALWESWYARGGLLRRLGPVALALLPSAVALANFVGSHVNTRIQWEPVGVRIWQLATLYSLVALDRWTTVAAVGTAACVGIAGLALLRRSLQARRLEAVDGLAVLAVALAALDLVVPDTLSGGGFVNQRLVFFPWLVLLLWLAARAMELPRVLRWAPLAGALLAGVQLAALWPTWAACDRLLAEAATVVSEVAPESTLLALSFAPEGRTADGRRGLAFRSAPFQHVGGWVAAERNVVDLALYAAHEDYFPIRYRADRDPYTYLGPDGGIESVPPRVDLAGYETKTGGRVDYVLLWQLGDEQRQLPATRALEAQLAAGYVPAFTSANGNARLYRRVARDAASAARTGPASAVATAR